MKWLTAALLFLAAMLAALLLYRTLTPPALSGGTALESPVQVPALALLNDQGQATTLAHSGGQVRLMFFGFVRCPDVCPTTLASLKKTYEALTPEQQARVQVQLVTVDPVFDKPALVREYLNKFNPAFTGLTGEAAIIDQAAQALYVANIKPEAQGNGVQADHSAHTGGPTPAQPSSDQPSNAKTSADKSASVSAPIAARIHGDEVRIITPGGQFVRVYNNQEALDGTLKRDLPALLKQYGGG